MTKLPAILTITLLLCPSAAAKQKLTPAEYIQEATARHARPGGTPLQSLRVRLTLLESSSKTVQRQKGKLGLVYSWTQPMTIRWDFETTPNSWQKPLQEALGPLWRDLSGALYLPDLGATTGHQLSRGSEGTTVAGTHKEHGPMKGLFESSTYRLKKLVFAQQGLEIRYKLLEQQNRFQLESREVWVGGSRKQMIQYGNLQQVNGLLLPTTMTCLARRNTLKFSLSYREINGQQAQTEKLSDKQIRDRIKDMEQAWPRSSDVQKIDRMKQLTELEHDRVSDAIARMALRDRSTTVRQTGAVLLGRMGRKNATRMLVQALQPNEAHQEVYVALCQALGAIDDPRAVRALSKNWWQHRTAGSKGVTARIKALGQIRHASAVDALIRCITIAHEDKVKRYARHIRAGLENQTGQDFGYDARAWKKWWKANRTSFSFS